MPDNTDIFNPNYKHLPLATRMRPISINDIVGQDHLLGEGKSLRNAISKGILHSLIFWGGPGVGKTSLARIIAKQSQSEFIELSAVQAGVKEIRNVVNDAIILKKNRDKNTVLFIDEIHRFSKSQQDSLLGPIENGDIILFGATTENPSFEINNALLSRLRVYVLRSLEIEDLVTLTRKVLSDKNKGLGDLNCIRLTRPSSLKTPNPTSLYFLTRIRDGVNDQMDQSYRSLAA